MEDTKREIKLVHVWRPSYLVSQPLSEGIEQLVKPGKRLPRLLLYGTQERAAELAEYSHFLYKKGENAARERFQQNPESVYFDPRVAAHRIGARGVRIAFFTLEQSRPAIKASLEDFYKLPNVLETEGGNNPKEAPPTEVPNPFLFIDIPPTHMRDDEGFRAGLDRLRTAMAAKTLPMLYSAHPDDIIGQEGERFVYASKEASLKSIQEEAA